MEYYRRNDPDAHYFSDIPAFDGESAAVQAESTTSSVGSFVTIGSLLLACLALVRGVFLHPFSPQSVLLPMLSLRSG